MVSFHLHRLLVVLFSLVSVSSANDRWVWSDQRNSRQLVKSLNPFLPIPFFPPWARPPPGVAIPSPKENRTPREFNPSPVVEEDQEAVPSTPTARGLPLKSLVVQPLPLDISKLPLETSESDEVQEEFAPLPPDSLVSSNQNLALTLPGEDFLASIQQEQVIPSLQTKTGHVEALVATPDISQLPLQSSPPSFSFSISTPDDALSSLNEEAVFPPHINLPASPRTVPPPSSTPVPTRIILHGFSGLDDAPFLRRDALEEKRILKTLEALQKETLMQNSRDIKIALQNLRRLVNDRNSVDNDRIVFPKVRDSQVSDSFSGGLQLIEPPRFNTDGVAKQDFFTLPSLHPQQAASSVNAVRPQFPPLLNTLVTASESNRSLQESQGLRESRRVPQHAWLWPRETSALPPRKAFHQTSHAL